MVVTEVMDKALLIEGLSEAEFCWIKAALENGKTPMQLPKPFETVNGKPTYEMASHILTACLVQAAADVALLYADYDKLPLARQKLVEIMALARTLFGHFFTETNLAEEIGKLTGDLKVEL